jgi:hypothetical protein
MLGNDIIDITFYLFQEITWKINNLIKSWGSEHRPKSLRNKLTRFISFVPVRSPVFGSNLHKEMDTSVVKSNERKIISINCKMVLCIVPINMYIRRETMSWAWDYLQKLLKNRKNHLEGKQAI